MYSSKKGVVFIVEGEVGLVCWPCFLKSRKQGNIKSWLNKKVILKLGRRFLYHAELYAKQLPCAYTFSICEILGLCHFCRLRGVKSINDSEVRRVPSFRVRKGRSLGSLSASKRSSAGCGACWRLSSQRERRSTRTPASVFAPRGCTVSC